MPTPVVRVDADRIQQVITNLLLNAPKYSAPQCPVMLRRREDGRAVVSVHDEGAGIPDEELPHLFERFYRVPGVEVQSGSGVGLGIGLYISRHIVEQHGARSAWRAPSAATQSSGSHCQHERGHRMVSDQELGTAEARVVVAGKLALGFLLGMGPLLMAAQGILAGELPGILNSHLPS